LFSTDLAYIHDAGFSDFAEGASPEIIRILRRHGIRPRRGSPEPVRIVEVGCGSGTLARHLVDAGYEVVGLDISPAMLQLARRKVPEATFRMRSLTEARLPSCDAMVAIGEVISYVPARPSGTELPAALRRFFTRVHDALEPGGLFVFDFIESAKRRTYQAKTKSGGGWVIAAHAELDASGCTLTRRLITIREIGRQHRRSQESHRVRIYTRRAVARALAAAGFTSRMSRAYGRYRLMAGDVAVIATKQSGRPAAGL
jgi:cyclopropane fatty-acyl-phospholipid synthase-like methyltransferase